MSDSPQRARLKTDVQAITGGPDPFTDPLTQDEQQFVELLVKQGQPRGNAEYVDSG
jgi:hypothetical protein